MEINNSTQTQLTSIQEQPSPFPYNTQIIENIPKKPFINFNFFRYLTLFEKIIYIICFSSAIVLAIVFTVITISSFIKNKDVATSSLMFGITLIFLPLIIVNKLRVRGFKRIPQNDLTVNDLQQLQQAEQMVHQLSSDSKKYTKLGFIISFISLIALLAIFYFLLNR